MTVRPLIDSGCAQSECNGVYKFMNQNKKTRRLEGIVVSDKMNKTRVVAVSWFKQHRKYLKRFRVTSRFKAHDENNGYKTGDKVIIEQTRPLSKSKRWRIIKKI